MSSDPTDWVRRDLDALRGDFTRIIGNQARVELGDDERARHRAILRAAHAEANQWSLRATRAENAIERVWSVLDEMPDSLAKAALIRALEGEGLPCE